MRLSCEILTIFSLTIEMAISERYCCNRAAKIKVHAMTFPRGLYSHYKQKYKHICIYIYIERERERERDRYTHIHTCIYPVFSSAHLCSARVPGQLMDACELFATIVMIIIILIIIIIIIMISIIVIVIATMIHSCCALRTSL